MKLSIIIPIYNEKNTLLKLLEEVKNADLGNVKKEIILVDDFSTDGTRDILKKLSKQYIILFHQKNCGKGRAIRTGLVKATGDIVIIQDADLEYDPNDYKKLIEPIITGQAKVVYGSRRLNKNNKQYSHLSFLLGGLLVNFITNLIYGLNITDEATCYKVFKIDVINSINLRCERFEFCPEITAKVAKKKIKIVEVPISYSPRSGKEGKKIKWYDGVEAIWTLIKYRFKD